MENVTVKAINTMRCLGMDMITSANSGHGGIVLGAAPMMYAAYSAMKVDPANPEWFNRDRFVMSAGHGSALLYSALYLFGFPISSDELKRFRQLGSPLTGHPEVNTKIGIDCETGPLGSGIATAVGLALAEKKLNAQSKGVVDHYTYCLVGDGCLMEGASYEACNLASTWKLNKLIVLYDSNNITLDGTKCSADGEDVVARFKAAGWNVLSIENGEDVAAIDAAIVGAKMQRVAPTIIIVTTQIGFGTKNAGSSKAHGMVMSAEEGAALREGWGLSSQPFSVDSDVAKHYADIIAKKKGTSKSWKPTSDLAPFINKANPKLNITMERKPRELRDAGWDALNQVASVNPRLFGGSADVASSTKVFIKDSPNISPADMSGRNIAFGIREFAMALMCNGLALHGFRPFCSAFLVFSDFAKAAIRLSALMDLPVTYIFTHDGMGAAQDGPTHQGNEHVNALRIIPNLNVYRPADAIETAAVYKAVFENEKPAAIVLSRGGVPPLNASSEKGTNMGAYTVVECDKPQAVLLSAGTEVSLCVEVAELLKTKGINCRVVSMPCMTQFDAQTKDYRCSILPCEVNKIAVELGTEHLWHKYADAVIAFDKFGASAKESDLRKHLGFTPEQIADKILKIIE
jgi:transketolase